MKKVVDGKRYDTETATKVGYWDNGLPISDFGNVDETLYRTKNGAYFLFGRGGALTSYSVQVGNNGRGAGRDIIAMTPQEALEWLEHHGYDVPDGCPEIAALVVDA
jgi:hypothetical protein